MCQWSYTWNTQYGTENETEVIKTLPITMKAFFIGILSDTAGKPAYNNSEAQSEGAYFQYIDLSTYKIHLSWNTQTGYVTLYSMIIGQV